MLTTKNHITHCSDPEFILDKQQQYSYAFRFLYQTIEESSTLDYQNKFKLRFNLTDIEFRSVVNEVKSFIKKEESDKKNKQKKLEEKLEEYQELRSKPNLTKKENYKLFDLHNDIQFLTKSLTNKPVFGGRKNLQKVSYLNNTLHHTQFEKEEDKLKVEQDLLKFKSEFDDLRLRSVFLMGEANQKGNRFFDFSRIDEGIIIYKPSFGVKIEIQFKIYRNQLQLFKKLKELSDNKLIAITVTFDKDYIRLSYDELILNGYQFDKVSKNKEVKRIQGLGLDKDDETVLIKQYYSLEHQKVRDKKLVGKLPQRCLAIDMNPEYIGFAVVDSLGNGDIKVVDSGCYDLSKLTKKLPKTATPEERTYQNNKRKYEIVLIIKELFLKAEHHKCSTFVMEDLDFKQKSLGSKEANRKTKNIWNRTLIEQQILKHCNLKGIELRKVEPRYSSFIGNIMYTHFDPINAAIELARRGLYRYSLDRYAD